MKWSLEFFLLKDCSLHFFFLKFWLLSVLGQIKTT